MMEDRDARLDALIRQVMPRRFRDRPIDNAANMHNELGIDSLGLMSLAFRVEEEFGVDVIVHADEIATVFTVGELRQFIDRFAPAGAAERMEDD
jgi:acyl carrier protein